MDYPTSLPVPARAPTARPSTERGQSLVEFALLGMFLIVLLMGVLDLGRMYYTFLALKDAAAEGAYYASAFPHCTTTAVSGKPGCNGSNNVAYRIKNSSPVGSLVDWNGAGTFITVTQPSLIQAGQDITVVVTYEYQMITPFVGAIAPNNRLRLWAESSAVIVRVPNCTVNPCK